MNYFVNENGMLCEVSDQSLMHYGVKGMKWGRRKAQKYAKEAKDYRKGAKELSDEGREVVASLRAKGKNKRADKLEADYKTDVASVNAIAKKYEAKAAAKNRGADYQKRQADVGASRSRGAKLATNLLAGPFANRTYNSVIAAGGSRVTAAAVTGVTAAVAGPLGHIAVASLYRRSAEDGNLSYQNRQRRG